MNQEIIDLVSLGNVRIWGTVCFVLAVLHTFLAKQISELSHRFVETSPINNFLHFLGEVEIVFGFWAFIFLFWCSIFIGIPSSVHYLDSVNFTEAVFVFCIMCLASTLPILDAAKIAISKIAKVSSKFIKIDYKISEYFFICTIGPLLGSFITEPAAMTVAAILLKDFLISPGVSLKFKYASLGLLFVNVSIGGVLTNYAAPPVLMVASKFGWSSAFMFAHFGGKAILIIILSTLCTTLVFRKQICAKYTEKTNKLNKSPIWMILVHLCFMILVVVYHKHVPFFLALFMLFLGWCEVTKKYQTPLRLRESLLVGFFLAGLVTLGNMQAWWLEKTISMLGDYSLYFGAAALTSITDNAALTYLGSLVPTLSETAKYMLVAGSVVGGGLTVIANAPNPAGYGILRDCFGKDGISPLYLFIGAFPFTLAALLGFLL